MYYSFNVSATSRGFAVTFCCANMYCQVGHTWAQQQSPCGVVISHSYFCQRLCCAACRQICTHWASLWELHTTLSKGSFLMLMLCEIPIPSGKKPALSCLPLHVPPGPGWDGRDTEKGCLQSLHAGPCPSSPEDSLSSVFRPTGYHCLGQPTENWRKGEKKERKEQIVGSLHCTLQGFPQCSTSPSTVLISELVVCTFGQGCLGLLAGNQWLGASFSPGLSAVPDITGTSLAAAPHILPRRHSRVSR